MKKRMKRGGKAMKKRTKRMGGGMMKKRMKAGGKAKKFPDLSGDGKVTKKDVLMGRGVIGKSSKKKTNPGTTSVKLGPITLGSKPKMKKPGGPPKMKKGGKVPEGYHRTKDGGVAKKGLYYYMNRAKKRGTSKPGKGTVTDKALKASAKTAKKR